VLLLAGGWVCPQARVGRLGLRFTKGLNTGLSRDERGERRFGERFLDLPYGVIDESMERAELYVRGKPERAVVNALYRRSRRDDYFQDGDLIWLAGELKSPTEATL